jgi:hypothetical protein
MDAAHDAQAGEHRPPLAAPPHGSALRGTAVLMPSSWRRPCAGSARAGRGCGAPPCCARAQCASARRSPRSSSSWSTASAGYTLQTARSEARTGGVGRPRICPCRKKRCSQSRSAAAGLLQRRQARPSRRDTEPPGRRGRTPRCAAHSRSYADAAFRSFRPPASTILRTMKRLTALSCAGRAREPHVECQRLGSPSQPTA